MSDDHRPQPPFDRLIDLLNTLNAAATAGDDATADHAAELGRLLEQLEAADRAAFEGVEMPGPSATFGRYQIQGEIDRGRFSVIYLAFDPNLNRRVALKMARPETMASREFRGRFHRETTALARLGHPNVVLMHEFGQVGPLGYIAMEYVEGGTLADWLHRRDRPVPPREAAGIVRALADGVQHAHDHGVVHRDLKPQNVLLNRSKPAAPDGPGVTPQLVDFGLAKLLDPGDDELTIGRGLIGSPPYMSPEQVQGDGPLNDPATDVYALGVILYELLVGQPPFRGENSSQTLQAVVAEDPVPLSVRRPEIPPDLEAVCLRCLRKARVERYQTAAELRDELGRFLASAPVRTRWLASLQHLLWRLRHWRR